MDDFQALVADVTAGRTKHASMPPVTMPTPH
jgi:hypothetical protein